MFYLSWPGPKLIMQPIAVSDKVLTQSQRFHFNTVSKIMSFLRVWSPSSGKFSGSHPVRSPRWPLARALLHHGSRRAAALHVQSTHSYGSRSCSSGWEPVVGPAQGSRQAYYVYCPARCIQVSPLRQEKQVNLVQHTDCGLPHSGNISSMILEGNETSGILYGGRKRCTASVRKTQISRYLRSNTASSD